MQEIRIGQSECLWQDPWIWSRDGGQCHPHPSCAGSLGFPLGMLLWSSGQGLPMPSTAHPPACSKCSSPCSWLATWGQCPHHQPRPPICTLVSRAPGRLYPKHFRVRCATAPPPAVLQRTALLFTGAPGPSDGLGSPFTHPALWVLIMTVLAVSPQQLTWEGL